MKITCKSATIGIIIGILILYVIKYGIIFGLCCLITWLLAKGVAGFTFSFIWPSLATIAALVIAILMPSKGGSNK